jgi:hypothetical protein
VKRIYPTGTETFDARVIENAGETKVQVDAQLNELAKAVESVKGARPLDQLKYCRGYCGVGQLPGVVFVN